MTESALRTLVQAERPLCTSEAFNWGGFWGGKGPEAQMAESALYACVSLIFIQNEAHPG